MGKRFNAVRREEREINVATTMKSWGTLAVCAGALFGAVASVSHAEPPKHTAPVKDHAKGTKHAPKKPGVVRYRAAPARVEMIATPFRPGMAPSTAPQTGGNPQQSAGAGYFPQPVGVDASGAAMSPAQAVAAATAFCKAVGLAVPSPGAATYLGVARDGDMAPTYWQPVWKVIFGNVAVDVSDADGTITNLDNYDSGEPDGPAGKGMDRAAAMAEADRVLKALHLTEPVAEPEADENQLTDPPTKSCHTWNFFWHRLAQGHPFQDQHVALTFNAETGHIEGLAVVFTTPAPKDVAVTLTADQAVAAATAFMKKAQRDPDVTWTSSPPSLTWITPRTLAHTPPVNGIVNEPPKRIPESMSPPVLTWYCGLSSSRKDYALVPVDAVTGDVVVYGLGFAERPVAKLQPRSAPVAPPKPPARVVLDHPIVATLVPGGHDEPLRPGSVRFKLSLMDVYIPLSALPGLGYGYSELDAGGADEDTARKMILAAKTGKVRMESGPTAIVPQHGVWAFRRTRDVICKDPAFWSGRSVPDRIEMDLSITPQADNNGEISYTGSQGTKELARGEDPKPGEFESSVGGGGGSGHEGEWTVLSCLNEEAYFYDTGKPGDYKAEGIAHMVLVKGVRLKN